MESTGELAAHLTSGAVVSYLIEAAKTANWLPLSTDTKALNRMISALAAAAVAIGINANFDATAGTLVITGLTLAAVRHGAYEWLQQMIAQQVVYDGFVAKPKPVDVQVLPPGPVIIP